MEHCADFSVNGASSEYCIIVLADFGPEWKEVYDSVSPQTADLPGSWDGIKGLHRSANLLYC